MKRLAAYCGKCRVWAEYAVPAALFLVLIYKIVASAVFEIPRPQIPPDGYVAKEPRVDLSWSEGDHRGTFRLQVAAGGNRFDELDSGARGADSLVVDTTLKTTTFRLPELEPGKEYCWRVLAEEDALVSCFRTSRSFIALGGK